MLSSIVLLSIDREKLQKCAFIVFLFIGILTAFFDFLTYPVATFGVPAIIYLMIIESDNIERKIADIVTGCISWGIGYLGMWMQKWILASIVTENNIIKNALQAILERTGSSSQTGEVYYGILSCIKLNYMAFFKTPVTILTFGYTLFLVIRYLKRRKAMNKEPESIVLPFIIVGGLPAVWYAITLNHSTIHHWFTNKACIVSLLAFLFMLESLTETSNLQTE